MSGNKTLICEAFKTRRVKSGSQRVEWLVRATTASCAQETTDLSAIHSIEDKCLKHPWGNANQKNFYVNCLVNKKPMMDQHCVRIRSILFSRDENNFSFLAETHCFDFLSFQDVLIFFALA